MTESAKAWLGEMRAHYMSELYKHMKRRMKEMNNLFGYLRVVQGKLWWGNILSRGLISLTRKV